MTPTPRERTLLQAIIVTGRLDHAADRLGIKYNTRSAQLIGWFERAKWIPWIRRRGQPSRPQTPPTGTEAAETAAPQEAPTPVPPPRTARLTQDQLEKARDWIVEKWKTPNCPFHGPTEWQIGELLAGVPSLTPVGGPNLNKVYPSLVLICQTCGYAVLVNAIAMGPERRG